MTARGVLRRTQGVSQRLVRKIKHGEGEDAGALYVNKEPAFFRDRVKTGDEIQLVFPKEKSWIEPEEIALSILYEDDDILVLDKQPGIVVHPTNGHRNGTIANGLIFHMAARGEEYKPRFINRLDMGTSGVLLIGKNSYAQDNLSKQNAAGSVEKIYVAVLVGNLEDDLPASGIIDLPIGLVNENEPNRGVIPEEEGGYPSQTEYEVIDAQAETPLRFDGTLPAASQGESFGNVTASSSNANLQGAFGSEPPDEILTVVRIRLITGRTHQIRVHFSHYGHPLLGDQLYGSPSPLIERQALHAAEISFAHPVSGQEMKVTAPIPEDMASLI